MLLVVSLLGWLENFIRLSGLKLRVLLIYRGFMCLCSEFSDWTFGICTSRCFDMVEGVILR